jgi:transposase
MKAGLHQALLNSPLSLNTGMVYCKISPDMKVRALELLQEGWEMEEVVEVLNVSAKSIGCWSDNLNVHGCVDPPSVRRGRPQILTAAMTEDLPALIQESPFLFLDKLREWLAIYHNQPISTMALHNNLRELGLTYKAALPSSTAEEGCLALMSLQSLSCAGTLVSSVWSLPGEA